jgi:hypothetical protein
MADDALERRLAQNAVTLSDKIESDFIASHGGPSAYILIRAKDDATEAMLALADVAPTDAKTIMALQYDIQRFRQLIGWMREAIEHGQEAWHKIKSQGQEELAETVFGAGDE